MFVFWLLLCIFTIFYYLHYHNQYWARKNVAFIRPLPLVGNLGGILSMRSSPAEEIRRLYLHPSAQKQAFVGMHLFNKPAILLRDPELIKRILVRDFATFCNRYAKTDVKNDPLGTQNIFFLRDAIWKEVRFKLSPFFTSSRLKNMLSLVDTVGGNLEAHLYRQFEQSSTEHGFILEAKELCAQFTTDVIATVAFGLEANSFTDPHSKFRNSGQAVFDFRLSRALGFICVFFLPKFVSLINFKVVPKEANDFLYHIFSTVIAERERTGVTRNDLIDLLIKHKKLSTTKQQDQPQEFIFDGDCLLAQATIFFTAGYESSSSTMAFALYELSKHEDIQKRLRQEIKDALAKTNGEVTQQVLDDLVYMQMVLQEVLRLYPPLPFLDRECTLPNQAGGYSMEPFSDFKIPHNMPVYIPVYGLQTDPQYFPDPFKFNPERFSTENKKLITPYTYLPFGSGPHGCIGERFATLQTKVGLLHILREYRVAVCERTDATLQLDPKALILQAKNGIYLSFIRDP